MNIFDFISFVCILHKILNEYGCICSLSFQSKYDDVKITVKSVLCKHYEFITFAINYNNLLDMVFQHHGCEFVNEVTQI